MPKRVFQSLARDGLLPVVPIDVPVTGRLHCPEPSSWLAILAAPWPLVRSAQPKLPPPYVLLPLASTFDVSHVPSGYEDNAGVEDAGVQMNTGSAHVV